MLVWTSNVTPRTLIYQATTLSDSIRYINLKLNAPKSVTEGLSHGGMQNNW